MANHLNEIRNYVKYYMTSKQYENAIYYAGILINGSQNFLGDVWLYIEALFNNKEYRRVIDFINKNNLGKKYLTFRYYEASCHFALNNGITAIQILDHNYNISKNIMNASLCGYTEDFISFHGYDGLENSILGYNFKQLENKCYLLLAEIYIQMENRDMATEYYKLAVKSDVKCYSAIQKLHSGNMLSANEAQIFLSSLDYSEIGNEKIAQLIKARYEDMFNIECETGKEHKLPMVDNILDEHYSNILNSATRYYNNAKFKKAYELTKSILKDDPHNPNCITLHVAILTELKLNNELFSFASGLIDNYPDKKESWYAIGCYSLVTGNYNLALQQFIKATEIEKFFGYAWLAIGHTYSIQKKSDQARAAYCSANQAIRGSHIPLLYIALEYSLDNNTCLSINYLQEAMKVGSHDPYFWNEKGYLSFKHKNYSDSLKFFLNAYEAKKNEFNSLSEFWEPLFNNIGHCFLKLGDYDKSLDFFRKALGKKPNNPTTLNSLALAYARKGDVSEAQNYLERVLGIDDNNLFSQLLLKTLIKLNAKYSVQTASDDHFPTKDNFKIPQLLSKDSSKEKMKTGNHFEKLRKVLNKDASKILYFDKPKK